MSPKTPEPGRAGCGRRGASRIAAISVLILLAFSSGAIAGEQWGWLGVRIRDLTEQEMEEIAKKVGVSEGYGVLIAQVMKETPAAASGLREGDLVVAIDGRPIVETRAHSIRVARRLQRGVLASCYFPSRWLRTAANTARNISGVSTPVLVL